MTGLFSILSFISPNSSSYWPEAAANFASDQSMRETYVRISCFPSTKLLIRNFLMYPSTFVHIYVILQVFLYMYVCIYLSSLVPIYVFFVVFSIYRFCLYLCHVFGYFSICMYISIFACSCLCLFFRFFYLSMLVHTYISSSDVCMYMGMSD